MGGLSSLSSIVLVVSFMGVSKRQRLARKEGLSGKREDGCFLTLSRLGVSGGSRMRLSSTMSQRNGSITSGYRGSEVCWLDGDLLERTLFAVLRLVVI